MMAWLSWLPTVAEAAFGVGDVVFDPTNLVENAATAVRTLEEVNLTIRDLSGLASLQHHLTTIGEIQAVLGVVLQIAERMNGRYTRWTMLIPVGYSVCTIEDLIIWQRRYRQDTDESLADLGYSAETFAGMSQALTNIIGYIQSQMGIGGSVQGLQNLHGATTTAATSTKQLQTLTQGYHEAYSRKELEAQVSKVALDRMSEARMAGLYGVPKCPCRRLPPIGILWPPLNLCVPSIGR
jgi:conjugal transfer/entry exclusion protein